MALHNIYLTQIPKLKKHILNTITSGSKKTVTFLMLYRTGIIKQFQIIIKTIWSVKCLVILNILMGERCVMKKNFNSTRGILPESISGKLFIRLNNGYIDNVFLPLYIINNVSFFTNQ
jgi:hypothetical protein